MSEPTDGYTEAQRQIDALTPQIESLDSQIATMTAVDAPTAYALAQVTNERSRLLAEQNALRDVLSQAVRVGAILRL